MAETGHNKEGQRAMTRDCPVLKLSVLEDLRVTSKRCGRGEEQNREEGEMAQTKLGGGRSRGKK